MRVSHSCVNIRWAAQPDQLLRGFHGGDDRRFLFIFKGSGISDHHIITLAEAFDRKVFAKIHDLIFPIVRDEHQVVRIQSIDRACDGFFLLASFRSTARRAAGSQKQNCAQARASKTQWNVLRFISILLFACIPPSFRNRGRHYFPCAPRSDIRRRDITNLHCFCIFHMDLDQASTCSAGRRCVLLPPTRRSRTHLPPVLSPCPTPA